MFDWRELRRWGISESDLPPGYVLRFKEPTLWSQHKEYVIGVVTLFMLQTALICWLLVEHNRRRRAEGARRHLAAIVEGSNDAIIGTSLDGEILSWNPGAEWMYGYSADEMLGRNISFLVPPDRLEEFSQSLNQRQQGGHIKDFETVRVKKDGTRIDVSESVSPIKDHKGRIMDATITRNISERKRSAQELQRLTGHLLNLQDDERRRLARELHDVTAQNLFVINMNLSRLQRSRLEPAEVQEIIDESRMLGNQSIQEIRTLSYLLHPPMLDQLGLVDALKWYVDGFVKRSGIEVEVLALQEIGRLPSEVETALFRIVQEGLTNIKRHSGSSSAKIKLEKDTDRIVLQIRDYGCGMRANVTATDLDRGESPGVGIPGMRQRVRQIGGDLAVASSDQGVLVTAIVPMTNGDGHDSNPAG